MLLLFMIYYSLFPLWLSNLVCDKLNRMALLLNHGGNTPQQNLWHHMTLTPLQRINLKCKLAYIISECHFCSTLLISQPKMFSFTSPLQNFHNFLPQGNATRFSLSLHNLQQSLFKSNPYIWSPRVDVLCSDSWFCLARTVIRQTSYRPKLAPQPCTNLLSSVWWNF